MKHQINLSPAEHVLVNRIRNAFPARMRDRLPDDAEILHIVAEMSKVFDLKTMEGILWLHESFFALSNDADEWERRYIKQRVTTYWAKEVAAGT
jgi:hypothetical protein